MKKIMKINIMFLLLSIFFVSCEDYLDLAPELEISENDVFENFLSVQGYLDNCYNGLADYSQWNSQNFSRNHPAAMSDEAASSYRFGPVVSVLNKGTWLSEAKISEVGYNDDALGKVKGRVISNSFYSIRIANKILERVPSMDNLSQEERDRLLGQAYFFRAWYYFEVIRRWGGMPKFDKVFFLDDQLDLPRLSYQESTEWLIENLDKARDLLPINWSEANKGRIDKVAALAVKSMATLYAASPLMQNDLNSIVQQEYSQEWSKLAARYAVDVLNHIDDNMPERQIKGAGMTPQVQQENYRSIFYHSPNYVGDESLWYKNSTGLNRDVHMSIHFQNSRFSKRNGNYGTAVTTPSQNLVDMFEMADGTAFDWTNPVHASNPYDNRDPRFYNNILYPGRQHGVDKGGKALYLETWDGGADIKNKPLEKTVPTGYMCIKWWWPSANGFNKAGYKDYFYNGVFIRTTQIWLDLAEAMNEAYGPNSDPDGLGYTALGALNKVRERVGMPDVRIEFTGSKEALRDRIRNERAVELMFEHHRWFDIRRWMIAEDVLSGTYPIQGISVQKNSGNNPSNWDFTYSVKDVTSEVRVFEKKHYWYPVARDHSVHFENFKQNPGW